MIVQVNVDVPQEFRNSVAEKSLFYVEVNPQGGQGPTIDIAGIAGNVRPCPEDLAAQVGLWIQRDVLQAIKETNTTPDEVTKKVPANLKEAPIKRVTKIFVPFVNAFVTAAGAAAAAPPADPAAAADAPLTKVVQASPTGRVSNGMFDVVHFRIDCDIEVDKIPLFIRTLSRNRLMSVLRVELRAVDQCKPSWRGTTTGTSRLRRRRLTARCCCCGAGRSR